MDGDSSAGRPTLDRDRIVTTAASFIDSDGVSALSMRRLGSKMGVEAMSLYRYVASREALLDGVVDQLMAEVRADPEVRWTAGDGWRDFVVRLAHGFRRMALRHPGAFSLVATRPTMAPFVRPPLRTLAWLDSLFAALTADGFSSEDAVVVYHIYSSWLLGHLLHEVGPAPDPDALVADLMLADGVADYPHLQAVAPELASVEAAADEAFETALTHLVECLEQLRLT